MHSCGMRQLQRHLTPAYALHAVVILARHKSCHMASAIEHKVHIITAVLHLQLLICAPCLHDVVPATKTRTKPCIFRCWGATTQPESTL